jgi:ketosteroid isomerase-like protein
MDNLNSALIRRYYTLVDAGDSTLFDLFHKDIEYKRPGYPLIKGLDELRNFYGSTRVISHGKHQIDTLFCTGEKAAVEGRFIGVLHDGTQVDLQFSDFFDLTCHRNGEHHPEAVIRARRTYFDDVRV